MSKRTWTTMTEKPVATTAIQYHRDFGATLPSDPSVLVMPKCDASKTTGGLWISRVAQ